MSADSAVDRAFLVAHLRSCLEARPAVRAFALGGSDATGRGTDELSDIDLSVVVDDDAIEATFAAVAAALEQLAPLRARLRMPEPTWHGFAQEFFSVEGLPEAWMIDLALIPKSMPPSKRFLEVERHGRYRVLFERDLGALGDGHFAPQPLDREVLARAAAKALDGARQRATMFGHMAAKALARGHLADAHFSFTNFLLRPLLELLRLRHAPERFDFGARYLDRDLPDEPRALIDELAFVGDPEALAVAIDRASERIARELAEHDAGRWRIEL